MSAEVIIKKEREKSLNNHHPWIFSGSIAEIKGDPQAGQTVLVRSGEGSVFGQGAFSPSSQIRVRMWTFGVEEDVDAKFITRRVNTAIRLRRNIIDVKKTNAFRLINGESDGLPGLIVDHYASWLVIQTLSAGADYLLPLILSELRAQFPGYAIYERSESAVRSKEGLPLRKGSLNGKEPPELIEIKENNLRFLIDIKEGHKTGFYLDQRDNRQLLSGFARDKEILNAFSYTAGFAVYALNSGARRVINIDASENALQIGRKNLELNALSGDKVQQIQGDVFEQLRSFQAEKRRFDVIILDPPKFVQAVRDIRKGSRGYKDINRLSFELLKPGGYLFTFSCSGHMKADLFQKIVADAALDARAKAVILYSLSQGADHPVALNFPEGKYLKGFVIQKLN